MSYLVQYRFYPSFGDSIFIPLNGESFKKQKVFRNVENKNMIKLEEIPKEITENSFTDTETETDTSFVKNNQCI